MRIFISIVSFALFALAAGAQAEVIYSTGFESLPFETGQTINGRGGFLVAVGNPAALLVTSSNPHGGTQGLTAFGAQLTGSDGFVQAAGTINPNYDAIANHNPIITLETWARLDGPSTNTGNGTLDDLVSINLDALLTDNSYFSTFLSSDGQAYGYFDNDYVFSGPAALGQYHDLKLVLDFGRGTSTYIVDNQPLGTLTFDSTTVQSTLITNAEISMNAFTPPLVDPANYTGYADDFSVIATPEPAIALLLLAPIGLRTRRRSRLR